MRVFHVSLIVSAALAAALAMAGCGGGSAAARVELPFATSAEPLASVTNDRGFRVELAEVTLPLRDLHLTGRGEQHARVPLRTLERLGAWVLPTAHAHPGHEAGGDVLGERLGPFEARFGGGTADPLGTVTVLEGSLRGGSFRFRGDAPVIVKGEAVRGDGSRLPLELEVSLPDGARVDGIPLMLDVTARTEGTLRLRLLPSSTRGRTLFDAIDFDNFDEAAARNAVARAVQDHAHFELVFQPEEE